MGRFHVDVEYYIASPQNTERWTMRWGQRYVDYSVKGDDYRDLPAIVDRLSSGAF